MYFFKKGTQLSFSVIFCSADSLLYPIVNSQILFYAELIDFKPLIFDGLFVATDANISVYHNCMCYNYFFHKYKRYISERMRQEITRWNIFSFNLSLTVS